MTFLEKLRCLQRLDQLIRMRAAGNAKQIAEKLDVSERTVYDLMETLKSIGAEIEYCPFNKEYKYKYPFQFPLNTIKEIRGGKNNQKIFYSLQEICSVGVYI